MPTHLISTRVFLKAWLLTCLLLVTLPFCLGLVPTVSAREAPPYKTETLPDGGLKYTDLDQQFELSLPQGWKLARSQNGIATFLHTADRFFISIITLPASTAVANINLNTLSPDEQKKFMDTILDGFRQATPEAEFSVPEIKQFQPEQPAVFFTAHFPAKIGTEKKITYVKFIILFHGANTYALQTGSFEKMPGDEFLPTLQTLHFFDK